MSDNPSPAILATLLPLGRRQWVLRHAINPALAELRPLPAPDLARHIMLAIAGLESRCLHRRQLGDGPARGLWQFERGGGKTLQIIIWVVMLLLNGKIKRALIEMPRGLVKQAVSEVNWASQGAINPVPMLQTTLERMWETLDMEAGDIISWIKGLPPNTICFTDFDYIKSKRDFDTGVPAQEILYGEKNVKIWPIAELFRRCGFDLVLLDESQRVKNLDSQKTIEQFVQENINFTETMKTEAIEYGCEIIDSNNKTTEIVSEEIISIIS